MNELDELRDMFDRTRHLMKPDAEVREALDSFTEMCATFFEYLEDRFDKLEKM